MSSKLMAVRILDCVVVALTMMLLLCVAGLPMEWLLALVDLSSGAFEAFALFALFAALWLIYAVASSDSAP